MGRIRKQAHGDFVDGPSASTKPTMTKQAAGSTKHHEHLAAQDGARRERNGFTGKKVKKTKVKKS